MPRICPATLDALHGTLSGEAYRTLKLDGSLHIWEATSRFDDPARFARELSKLGFKASFPEERDKFTYIEAKKTARAPVEGDGVRFRE